MENKYLAKIAPFDQSPHAEIASDTHQNYVVYVSRSLLAMGNVIACSLLFQCHNPGSTKTYPQCVCQAATRLVELGFILTHAHTTCNSILRASGQLLPNGKQIHDVTRVVGQDLSQSNVM